MDISNYVEQLRADLAAAAEAGGAEMTAAARQLGSALDAAVRLALLEALSDAAAEITIELGDRTVEVRLQGRDPHFAVDTSPESVPLVASPARDEGDDNAGTATARITLRLGEGLKARAEQAASQARQSLNTWLVDAIRDAVEQTGRRKGGGRGVGQHLSGWVR